jgi:GNAT superfamily N-acetyltransferase
MTDERTNIVDVTTWSLEMLDPGDLVPSATPAGAVHVIRAEVPSPELSRFLYTSVGGDWYWYDRLPWSYERWQQEVNRTGHETWLLLDRGTPAGHFVLVGDGQGTTEITYFGLLPAFIGKGFGGYLLTEAIRAGWSLHERWPGFQVTTRVWVHTCSLDGQPAALANYQARGLKIFKVETKPEALPAGPTGPWPNAR